METFVMASNTMAPTIRDGERVTVNPRAFVGAALHRSDIVAFHLSKAQVTTGGVAVVVKRVVGLPGETISSGAEGRVLINGHVLDEPYLTAQSRADPGPPIPTQRIPPGDTFVMGDNRSNSYDSREFGPIPLRSIVGQVVTASSCP
jgi:signal peptidase I